ncbi:unnamed protein product [Lathyrus sativus]|nr:unnamed protein product [Lathyrus sativus]
MSALDYYLSPSTIYLHSHTIKSNFHHWRNARSFVPNSSPVRVLKDVNFLKDFGRFHLWRGLKLNNIDGFRTAATGGSETDSGENSGESTEVEAEPGSGVSWEWLGSSKPGNWKWELWLKAQLVGVLLLQLGIVVFFMRFFRLEIPLPGSEPSSSEVDGVRIAFMLKSDLEGGEVPSSNSSSGLNLESESLVKSVAPTKRVIYTTTRPSDIRTPYEKMLENKVEFGSPDRRLSGFFNPGLIVMVYVAVLAGLLHDFPASFSRIRSDILGTSTGTKSSEKGETITFADVAGIDEAKEELEEIVEFLRDPDKYVRLGARPPRGVLLVGPPGTGKTLLAKAIAGEADVPFISCSASEFVELYVGMGASRVRDLFARAKKEAQCIIFIDEIDAVAKSRDGKFRIGSDDEREQTLNQLLTEMDGFDSNPGVIVIAATNRADVLDPALRRPGRFDRVVMVETPDRIGRESILKVHVSMKELPLAKDVYIGDIASMTTGFTGADLANLVNEAALLAGRKNKVVVEKIDFIEAVERSIAGIEKKTAKLQGCEKGVVARHEAGHAVVGTAVANLIPGQPHVQKVSILPRSGGALGFTYIPPTNEDRYLLLIDDLRGRLVTLLGGRAAEEIVYSGRVSTGALDDIRRGTDMAYKAIAEYGFSQTIGPVSISTLSNGGMDESVGSVPWGRDQGQLVDLVQKEVKSLLQSALEVALSIVRANRTVVESLGAQLEEKEKVEGEELQKWLRLVVAPTELAIFMEGKQQTLLPLQSGS